MIVVSLFLSTHFIFIKLYNYKDSKIIYYGYKVESEMLILHSTYIENHTNM